MMDRSKPCSTTFSVCVGLQIHFCGFSDGRCLQRALMRRGSRQKPHNFPPMYMGVLALAQPPLLCCGSPMAVTFVPRVQVGCKRGR